MTGAVKVPESRALSGRFAAFSASLLFLAGAAALIGWRLGWQWLLPRLPGSEPMSPDSAVAFLFVALILFLLRSGHAPSFRIGPGCIFIAGGIALAFLDRTHIPRQFNQAVFQPLGIHTHKAYPHMALATGIGFALWGLGSICLTKLQRCFSTSFAFLAAVCGTSIMTLGSICLLSYFLGIPGQESGIWAHWVFRMATESAALFLCLGAFLCQEAWSGVQACRSKNQAQNSLIAGLLVSAGFFLMFLAVNVSLSLGLKDSLHLRAQIARDLGAIRNISELVAAVRETESGQRGFLLTDDETYLKSYWAGIQRLSVARNQRAKEGEPWPHPALDALIDAKMSELAETVQLAQSGYRQEALTVVKTGQGFNLMADIEREAARANIRPERSLTRRSTDYGNVIAMVRRMIGASYGLVIALLFCAAYLFRKEIRRRIDVEQALRMHEAELANRIKERTAELQASESRYRAMLEQSPFAVHILDRHGNSAGVNPAFEKFFGVGTDALRGYNIWADPQPVRQGTVELLKRTFAGEMTATGTVRHEPSLSAGMALADSGTQPAWVEFFAYPVRSAAGEVQEVVILCQDVTIREQALGAVRESEFKFRQVMNTLPKIVWTAIPDGTVDYYNERWYEFTGAAPGVHLNWSSFVHPDDLGPCLESWEAAFAGKSMYIFELRFWNQPSQSYRWYRVKSIPVLTPSGEVQRWVGSGTDIHDQKEAAKLLEEKVRERTLELETSYKLLQSKEESLRQSLAERDTLFREVHHRVKNNLQVISSLLRMHGQSLSKQPVAAAALEEARRRVMSMAMIHERLYAHQHMDRIDFGEYTETLVRELMHLFALPDKTVESRINAAQVQLGVEQAIPCGLILNELITNALKYAFKDRPSGLITVALSQTESDQIILVVADDGVGLPDGFNWKKSKSMGLPIVDILARQLDGHVKVESQAGLKVTIQFPRRASVEKAA